MPRPNSYAVFCLKKQNVGSARRIDATAGRSTARSSGSEGASSTFNYTASAAIHTLSLHDALPICSRARRCVEACVYGTLDFVGYPRFPAPVEFIAAVIAYYVHPVNIQTACLIMEGAEFTENIINGVERPVKAAELFAFTLRV